MAGVNHYRLEGDEDDEEIRSRREREEGFERLLLEQEEELDFGGNDDEVEDDDDENSNYSNAGILEDTDGGRNDNNNENNNNDDNAAAEQLMNSESVEDDVKNTAEESKYELPVNDSETAPIKEVEEEAEADKDPAILPGGNKDASFDVEELVKPLAPLEVASPPVDGDVSVITEAEPIAKPPPKLRGKMMFKNLVKKVQQRQFESEAETAIQRALEQLDPTGGDGTRNAQENILPGVPADAAHVFTSSGANLNSSQNMRKKLSQTKPESRSKAEELWLLTSDLMKMQSKENMGSYGNKSLRDSGAADILANNAALLLRRHKSSKSTGESTTAPEPTVPAVSATSRWKTLKASVQVAGAMGTLDSKKDDDARLERVEEGFGEDSESLDAGETTGGKTSLGKRKAVVLSGFHDFHEWVKFKRVGFLFYFKVFLYLVIPAIGTSAILFYLVDNPPCGTSAECREALRLELQQNRTITKTRLENLLNNDDTTAVSWWILFVCVRHLLVFGLAAMTEAFIIDFLALRTKLITGAFGPMVTLLVIQSKGWPFLATFWGVYSFALLYGDTPFANNWLHWQKAIDLFNENNPSGGVTSLETYRLLLIIAIFVGVASSLKRFVVGFWLGKKTFLLYSTDLAKVMRKAILIGQIATLAKDIEKYEYKLSDFDINHEFFDKKIADTGKEDAGSQTDDVSAAPTVDGSKKDQPIFLQRGLAGDSMRMKINKLLGDWDEPEIVASQDERITIAAIVQFRNSLSCLNARFPFSTAFGPARDRAECIDSAETVFRMLIQATPGTYVLDFDVMALIAIHADGTIDEDKLKELIRLFRPQMDGSLTLVDFAKSVDEVYKELRLLRASVANNSRMDRAFEKIANIVFYFLLGCIVLAIAGIDPMVLFASVSGFVLAFAFMIRSAASNFFEGVLFILVRRPYDIGDRIHVSSPEIDTKSTGSATWFVRDVTLFTTTVCMAATAETATYSNGSLANSRIINANRSPKASLWFLLKFPVDAPYKKLQVMKGAIEEFVKARPREYISFNAFRCTRIEVELGFVEYIVAVSHVESWQNTGPLKTSLAELTTFALEVSKKMNLHYTAPPKPINLNLSRKMLADSGDADASLSGDHDFGSVTAMFTK